MHTLIQDLRHGVRMLARSPGFTLVAVLTLALGIGANTAIFSVVDAVLLKPLAYKDSTALINVWGKFDKQGVPALGFSEPEYWDLLDRNRSFSEIAMYAIGASANLTRPDARPAQVSEAKATAGVFPLLGITPILGRPFSANEDQPGQSHVALLSYALWQGQFAGDPEIAGKSFQLDGETYTVTGVLAPGFSLGGKQDLWVPLGLNRAKPDNRGNHYFHTVARLKPGVSVAQAAGTISQFADDLRRTYPAVYGPSANDFGMYVVPMKEQLVGKLRPALLVLAASVLFVLLIACANVANLLLTHASSREKELAIRAALGAGRSRLARQLLTECVLLACGGGLLGLVLASWGLEAMRAFIPPNTPRMEDIGLDPIVLAFTFGTSILTGLAFGLAPAWHVGRTDLRESLNDSGRGTSAGGKSRRLRAMLVVSELALAVVLLAGAGLLIRSFSRLLDVSPGFETQHLLTVRLSLPEKTYADGAPVQKFFAQVMTNLQSVPAIKSAGAVSEMPLTDSSLSGSVYFKNTPVADLPRYEPLGNLPYLEIDQRAVTPGYFEAMQIPLVRGRMLTNADNAGAQLVAVVDETFARRFWPQSDAIGQQVAVDAVPDAMPQAPRWRTIVGVVGHVKHNGLDSQGREQIYLPHAQPMFATFVPRTMTLTIRTLADPASVTNSVRAQVSALDKDVALYDIATMDEIVSSSVAQPRLNLSLLAAFAALAVVLAAIGVYGVMAYAVSQRTHEFGIRMALGAEASDVLRHVFLEGGRLAAAGLALGVASALALTQLMASLLFDVEPRDPATLSAAAAVLAIVALAACYIPARRATRVDPLVALRSE